MTSVFSKYKLVVAPLLIVLLFDCTLLVSNLYVTSQIDDISTNINIAGRQRMLSQKIAKSVNLAYYFTQTQQSSALTQTQAELAQAITLFDQTLNAFSLGGEAMSASGHPLHIKKLSVEKQRDILQEAERIWLPLKQQLAHADKSVSAALIERTAMDTPALLKLMNDLTNALEEEAEKKTTFLRFLQVVVVLIIFASFIMATVRLYRRELYYDKLMENTKDVVIGVNAETGIITFISSSVSHLLGYDETHYIGNPASLLFTGESKALFYDLLRTATQSQSLPADRYEVTLLSKQGKVIVADMIVDVTLSENGRHIEVSADLRDISERKSYEVALSELAHKDTLTKLPNRVLFYELAEHALNVAKRHQSGFALMFIDLDGFKQINDQFGHQKGDAVLVQTATRILSCLRSADNVARLGGDEFIILVDETVNKDALQSLAMKIIEAVSQPFDPDGCVCQVGASIGISIYPNDAEDLDTLVNKADNAMYRVKNSGKNNVFFAN
jgi:diguanylate cyclase (GGDEF)-like protein/PAS domain S-box-containing protein